MNKNQKLVMWGILFSGIFVIAWQIISQMIMVAPCEYDFIDGEDNRYHWLFQDNVTKNLTKVYSMGNDHGAVYAYEYRQDFRFIVWEINDFDFIRLNQITVDDKIVNKDFGISPPPRWREVFMYPRFELEALICHSVNSNIGVCFDKESKMSKETSMAHYRSFYGCINKFSIVNEKNANQIIFSYDIPTYTNLILMKAKGSFFLIVINALDKGKMDTETLKLLKLPADSSSSTANK